MTAMLHVVFMSCRQTPRRATGTERSRIAAIARRAFQSTTGHRERRKLMNVVRHTSFEEFLHPTRGRLEKLLCMSAAMTRSDQDPRQDIEIYYFCQGGLARITARPTRYNARATSCSDERKILQFPASLSKQQILAGLLRFSTA